MINGNGTKKHFWKRRGRGQRELQHATPEMSAALLEISMYAGAQVRRSLLENHYQ